MEWGDGELDPKTAEGGEVVVEGEEGGESSRERLTILVYVAVKNHYLPKSGFSSSLIA